MTPQASPGIVATLTLREEYRDRYGERRDPIFNDRCRWRAQTMRHIAHILPGQSILELGAGRQTFTRELVRATRGENPITAVVFRKDAAPSGAPVETVAGDDLPQLLATRRFDYVVGLDLLDARNCTWLLQAAHHLLKPGGHVMFYESNPWNVVLRLRRAVARLIPDGDRRRLIDRASLYELMSEVGFVKVLALYNDFVYSPLRDPLVWTFRNLSTLLENTPLVRTLAGSILIRGQKPADAPFPETRSLCEHAALRGAVSVVIPCRNEETNVRPMVARLTALYREYLHEIVLVDDASDDGTAGEMEALALEFPIVRVVRRTPPSGVGRALAEGFRVATGRFVLTMDCDFVHLLPEMRDLFDAAAGGCDVVVGSRFSRHSVLLNYPFNKIVANRTFHLLAQLSLRRRFRDLTNNLKLLDRRAVECLELREPGFAANAETGLQPLLMGFSVREVPISWINRTPGMGSSSFRLAQVGGGYWRVLARLALATRFGTKPLRRGTGRPDFRPEPHAVAT